MKFAIFVFFVLISGSACAEESDVEYLFFDEITSTQAYAVDYGNELLIHPSQWVVVSANHQTHGVGMHGDRWISNCPENIYVTYLCFFPKNKGDLFFYTPLVVALSITKTLEELGLSPEIKWINDVVVNKKKIAGILCEWIPSDHSDYFIALMGVGLNVNMSLEEAGEVDQPATSIMIESGSINDKDRVFQSLFNNVQHDIEMLKKEGFSPFKEVIRSKMIDGMKFNDNIAKLMKNKFELDECLVEKK